MLADLATWADPELEGDRYGTGPLIADFEAEVAALLGKEAALFLPSGTMAQPIALRIWADRKGLVGARARRQLRRRRHREP